MIKKVTLTPLVHGIFGALIVKKRFPRLLQWIRAQEGLSIEALEVNRIGLGVSHASMPRINPRSNCTDNHPQVRDLNNSTRSRSIRETHHDTYPKPYNILHKP